MCTVRTQVAVLRGTSVAGLTLAYYRGTGEVGPAIEKSCSCGKS